MATKESATEAAVKACTFSGHYEAMYQQMGISPLLPYPNDEKAISKALFYHLAKIKYAGWQYRMTFKRARKHSLSDIFQDLLALYLRGALCRHGFEIRLEQSVSVKGGKRIQVDILILKDEIPFFAIEAKTTIGWDRPDKNASPGREYSKHEKRLEYVAKAFNISPKNVIYVYEEPTNVSATFEKAYWDKSGEFPGKPALFRPSEYPLSRIYPLFFGTDPLYWGWDELTRLPSKTRENPHFWCPPIDEPTFFKEAEKRIVTPVETVVELILSATPP
jgi:hypothetical protein